MRGIIIFEPKLFLPAFILEPMLSLGVTYHNFEGETSVIAKRSRAGLEYAWYVSYRSLVNGGSQ